MVILIGFTAAVAQIVLLRELMVVFYGNEISLGLMLASWLLWTAIGSSLAGRVSGHGSYPNRLMAVIQVLLAAVLPGTVVAVRSAKSLLQTVPGEVLGPGAMLLTSLAVLGPLCMLSGALFTAGSRLYAARAEGPTSASAGAATGSVYLWEAAGSSAGGLAAGLVLVRFLGSLETAWLLALLNLIAACGLAIRARPLRRLAIGALVGIAALLEFSGALANLEAVSQQRFWRGLHLIATRSSWYGNLAVTGTEGSRSIYENGVILSNAPDPAAAEEAVHYALLEHPAPRSLLLIGGGINGSITEALRHPGMERLDYVELDPAILDLARGYFPREWRGIQADSRVRVHVADGRWFVKTSPTAFDVVIVNLPDPQNAQLNRFFTLEFFREVSRKLTPNGVFSFQLRSSENYISPELAQFLRTIHATLRAVFPEITVIPGETVHFFAARRAGVLASGAPELLTRLHARNLQTSYVNEYLIPFRMTPDRMLDIERQIRPVANGPMATPVNHDFVPVAYYFDVALWSSQFHQGYRRLFRALAGIPFGVLLAAAGILLALSVLSARSIRGERRRLRVAAGSCVAASGFTMIGIEVLLLLGFQALYGYVYQQLALVIAAFMAGMALGSWLALRRTDLQGTRLLGITQMLVAAAPLVLLALFEAAERAKANPVSPVVFPAAALYLAVLGGFEFPLASRIFFWRADAAEQRHLGALYALDLAGSSLGAILFSTWFVPVFGFLRTALLSAMVSMAPAALAMACGADSKEAEPPPAGARRTPGP